DVFLQHHGADVITTKTQAHLADLQALRYPARLHVRKIRKIDARDRERLQIFDCRGFFPSPAAKCGVLRLEGPWNKRGESPRLFLQFINASKMIYAMFERFADDKHHRSRRFHSELVGRAMDAQP